MNILYGIQGTGNGHITRSREMVTELRRRGHQVRVIVSGRSREKLWDMDDLEPFEVYRGLSFATENGRIKRFDTFKELQPITLVRDVNRVDSDDYDLVITDYEPITSRVAQRRKLTSIGLGHQYAFSSDIPKKGFDTFHNLIMQYFAPATLDVGLHWHHFNQAILPPIIPDMDSPAVVDRDIILVYLPFEDQVRLLPVLHAHPGKQFLLYTDRLKPGELGNVTVRSFSRVGFHADLVRCSGVICNSGFELPSEVLALGKKLYTKPLRGQPEQVSNALALKEMKRGTVVNEIDVDTLGGWLEGRDPEPMPFRNTCWEIAGWIESGDWNHQGLLRLAELVWNSMGIPFTAKSTRPATWAPLDSLRRSLSEMVQI